MGGDGVKLILSYSIFVHHAALSIVHSALVFKNHYLLDWS